MRAESAAIVMFVMATYSADGLLNADSGPTSHDHSSEYCVVWSKGGGAPYYNFGILHREAAVTLGRSRAVEGPRERE
jgi:hypothetical protein